MIIRKILQDGGATWTTTGKNNLTSKAVTAVCVTPTGRIIAGDLTYSDDGGTTWQNIIISNSDNKVWTAFCITPTGRIIACGYNNGIDYSDDNGITWTAAQIPLDSPYNNWESLCITLTGRIITGNERQSGLYYSDDNGVHWAHLGLTGKIKAICVTPTGRIIAGINANATSCCMYYSDDDGETWISLADRMTSGADYPKAICVTITGRIIVSGSMGWSYSDDDGETWSYSSYADNYPGASFNIICFGVTSTGRIIVGTWSAGIWYSDDNGVHWTQSSITSNHISMICVLPTDEILAVYGNNTNAWRDGIIKSEPMVNVWSSKYLDRKGARELVTQFKAYVDSLVGGNS